MSETGTNGNSKSGYSGTSLLLMFAGGALAGALGAYLAQKENRSRVGALAKRTGQNAGLLPQAVRDASHAAKEAFVEAYSGNNEPVAVSSKKH